VPEAARAAANRGHIGLIASLLRESRTLAYEGIRFGLGFPSRLALEPI
jgi:hypothetical protein